MWNQWPVTAISAAPMTAPPQPSVPPPLPDAPPPPPPADNAPPVAGVSATTVAATAAVSAAYMGGVSGGQSATNPYEQYTAAQYAAMTPEQQYALQQHWQQWQTYQQEYAKWHAQYGEQYKREMAAAAAVTTAIPAVAATPVVAAPVIASAVPVAAPVAAAVPAIGSVYPQMPLQQAQPHAYYAQMQVPPVPMQPQQQHQTSSQTQLPGKIMAQPQMYNQPPPPPPQGYQQQQPPPQQNRQQQAPVNQWQQQPPPANRYNQMPPVGYGQQSANPSDPAMFPNLQQPPPSFMQQPPTSVSDSNNWSKGPSNNNNNNDRSKNNDVGNSHSRWDGSQSEQKQGLSRINRWQSNEQGNNNNNSNTNKQNSFEGRRSWQNNASGNNNNNNNSNNNGNKRNPFSSGPHGNDNESRAGVASNSGNFGGPSPGNYPNNSNYGNGPGAGLENNFGPGNYDNNRRTNNNNNNNGRWNQNNNNYNDGGFNNRGPNQQNFNQQQQQQRAPELDEASFDRLFDQWEQQFEDWKRANANHPDRDEYRRYEEEFEKQRRRIAERREQMRRRRQFQNPQQQQLGDSDGLRHENDHVGANDDRRQQIAGHSPGARPGPGMNNKMREQPDRFDQPIQKQKEQQQPRQAAGQQSHSQQSPKKPAKANSTTSTTSISNDKPNRFQQQQNRHQDGDKNKTATLGKRHNDEAVNVSSSATPAKQTKQNNVLVISLDDDDEGDAVKQRKSADKDGDSTADTPMKNIFKKSDGIPGLDLVADGSAAAEPTAAEAEASSSLNSDASNVDSNKKIPSLFDVVIAKPGISPPSRTVSESDKESQDKAEKPVKPVADALPDNVSDALKDPEFMNNLSQALAQAQGREREQQQQQQKQQQQQQQQSNESAEQSNNNNNDEGRPLSFAEWQRKKNNNQANSGSQNQEECDGNENNNNFGNNFGPGNGPGNRGSFGPGGPGFGPDHRSRFGPNGPGPFGPCGPGDAQLMGPNFNDFPGPNGPNFGGPNFGRGGGPGGPFDGPGPGHFGRNFGPGGPNFPGPGPNFNDHGPGFGPNFRGNGPPFRPNFGPNGPGPGPNFGGPGPFGGGPGPGPGMNGPFDRNFGPGGPNHPNDRNLGPRPNFNGPNNNNNSFNENPFRRNGGGGGGQGPNNFEPDTRDGPGFGHGRGRGPHQRNSFGNVGHNDNKPWSDGGRSKANRNMQQQRGPSAELIGNAPHQQHPIIKTEPVYRPMQVFDYQNSRNTAAKVIDYGHKSADSVMASAAVAAAGAGPGAGAGGVIAAAGGLPEFRPVNTFDYGHASHTTPPQPLSGANPMNRNANIVASANNKKKNKKKNKNRQRQQQQQQQQQQPQQLQQQDQQSSSEACAAPASGKVDKPDDLEDISDGEDNLTEVARCESPPPPPKFVKQPQQQSQQQRVSFPANPQRRMLGDPAVALFPSTAAANQRTPEQSDAHHLEMSVPTNENRNTISIDEVLLPPGRLSRPKRICIILRGPPGSGKSYVARLIKDKELEMGGANPRILSIDDYFIIENDYEEKCPKTGKKIPKKEILYEYDDAMEETYMQYLIKSFKKTLIDNLYDLVIVDCNNNSLRTLNEFYCNAKDSNFVPYIIDLHCDLETCLSRNMHQRSEKNIRDVLATWCSTPLHYIKLDVSSLLENIVEMEDVENMATDNADNANANSEQAPAATDKVDPVAVDEEDSNSADATNDCGFLKSKWENDTTEENLARLDGTNRLMEKRKTASMADYLQLDDWEPPKRGADGKKRVRWADIEEKRAQQKMRAIGFVVGQTDWKRMMDPNAGNRALNKTKYIERVNKRR